MSPGIIPKTTSKRDVFSRWRNVFNDSADAISAGKSFLVRGATNSRCYGGISPPPPLPNARKSFGPLLLDLIAAYVCTKIIL